MTDFVYSVLASLPDDAVVSAALGVNAAGKLTDFDKYKALKLAGNNNYVLAADGDDIEGVLVSVEPFTVNNGFGFGSVQTKDRIIARNDGAGAIAVRAQVIAAAQGAVGTANTTISTGALTGVTPTPVKAGTGAVFNWRVISLLGAAGAVGDPILIERV